MVVGLFFLVLLALLAPQYSLPVAVAVLGWSVLQRCWPSLLRLELGFTLPLLVIFGRSWTRISRLNVWPRRLALAVCLAMCGGAGFIAASTDPLVAWSGWLADYPLLRFV